MNWSVMVWSAMAIAVVMFSTWLLSLVLKNASIVDPVWSLGFVIVGWTSAIVGDGDQLRVGVLLVIVTIWGVRLSLHLFTRNRGHGEDFRYKAMRKKHGERFWLISLVTVFVTQGVLMFVVSLPLQFGAGIVGRSTGWSVLLVVGVAVWLVGFGFESVGDAQLKAFKADPASQGQVMDRGLWRYTRHPNYFGDACVWWGILLVSLGAGGWAYLGIVGPILMTTLLRRVSGVTLLEKSLVKRRPGYSEYVRRTSAFIPKPPRN
ncbi:COG3752 Steroid 5-alpha reductase family enzyme [Acidimicrobiia bacterium]